MEVARPSRLLSLVLILAEWPKPAYSISNAGSGNSGSPAVIFLGGVLKASVLRMSRPEGASGFIVHKWAFFSDSACTTEIFPKSASPYFKSR